ncbi:MAG: hypothetical protein IJW29_06580 [Clostridia bacterium]|nr:hypothetical protein [Clostridia bacterium]
MKNAMKRLGLLSLVVLMLASVLMLAACNDTEDATTKKPDDGTTTTTGGNINPPPPANPTYTVKFVDQNGTPVQGVRVQFCVNETCTPMMAFPSGADGIITITHMAENAYDVKILSLPSGYAEDTAYYQFNSENYLEIVLNPAA